MANKIQKRRPDREREIRFLESKLQGSLKPVSPRPDFVHDLRRQLTHQFEKLPDVTRFSRSNFLLMAIALLLCVFLVIILSIRAALTLIGAFSLLFQYRRQAEGRGTSRLGSIN